MPKPPLFYLTEDSRSAFWILLGVYFVSETLIARFLRAGRADRTDDRGSLLLFVTILPLGWFVAFMLAGIPWAFFGNAALYRAGLVVIGAGQLLRWWSIATLGRFFTVNVAIRAEHRLIDSGPYQYVRHPAYTAVLLVHLGTSLCLGNALSLLALTVPLLATLVNRMRVEEDVLIAGLGQPYRDYMGRTKRLIPRIY
jgi:protein-S-isoprenylcysteine O-methyltransferase Ste14